MKRNGGWKVLGRLIAAGGMTAGTVFGQIVGEISDYTSPKPAPSATPAATPATEAVTTNTTTESGTFQPTAMAETYQTEVEQVQFTWEGGKASASTTSETTQLKIAE